MMKGLGCQSVGEVWGDVSAALGIIHRHGLGKTRHIDTSLLRIQEMAASKRLKCMKTLGKENPAELFSKYLDNKTSDYHLNQLAFEYSHGRASEPPQCPWMIM